MLDLVLEAINNFNSQTFVNSEAAVAQANLIAAQFSAADPNGSFSDRTALFFSGEGSGAAAAALAFNSQTEFYTILNTDRGRFLDGIRLALEDYFPTEEAYKNAVERAPGSPWFTASQAFASSVTGGALVILNTDLPPLNGGVHPNSVFLQAEVPALLSNPNNPTLNGFDGTALTNFADNNARVSALSSAFPMSNVPNIVNAVNDARSHFGDGTANPDVIAGNLTSLMVDSVIANNTGNPINMPDARATLTDTIAAFMTDESGGVSFDQAQQSAGRFIDALGSMLDRPGFEAAFKNGLLSGIGSTFGDLAELANALYEPFKTGIKTGDWSDFGGVALELGINTVLRGLAIAGLGAAVSLAFGPAVGAAFAAAVLAYGLWEGFNAFFNLGSAILKDLLDGDFQQYILNPLINWLFDPLTLDLDGDGIELISLANSNVNFDLDGNGFAERTGWVSSDDGMLVRDGNRNGNVDSVAELFGSATQDGFAVLETFDDNHDGQIDAQDAVFADLKVWRDLNQNGVSELSELFTLAQLGIQSISIQTQDATGTNQGHDLGVTALFTRADGTTGEATSIYFQTDGENSIQDETGFVAAAGVELLPQLPRSGNLLSTGSLSAACRLRTGQKIYTATNDATFRADLTALVDTAGTMGDLNLRGIVNHIHAVRIVQ